MNNDSLKILKNFSRKILNSRFRVSPKVLIRQLKNGEFGYSAVSDNEYVVPNDFVLVDDFLTLIEHVKAIFREPSIFIKKESIITNAESASKYDNATLRDTYKDEKLWRIKDGAPSPEYIHSFVYEDNLAIYENKFVCFVIDQVYEEVCKKIIELSSSVETLNQIMDKSGVSDPTFESYVDFMLDDMPMLVTNESATVGVIRMLIKTKKLLISLKNRELYGACKKSGDFNPNSLKPTNILTKHEDYRYVYKFYLDYCNREINKTELDKTYLGYVTVNLLGAIDKLGFVLDENVEKIGVTNAGVLRFGEITFNKSPFTLSLSQEGEDGILLTVKEIFDGSEAKYLFRAVNDVRMQKIKAFTGVNGLIKSCQNTDGIIRTFIVNDLEADNNNFNALFVSPELSNGIDVLAKAVKSCLLLAFGSSFMHDRYCAVCGSSLLAKGDDITCTSCGALYHIFEDDGVDYIWFKDLPNQAVNGQNMGVIEPLDEVAFTSASKTIRKSFMQKLASSPLEVQGYYNSIKHELLCFKKVKSRVSFSYDRFNLGRPSVAKIGFRGKTLVLYLALNPNDYVDTKYFPKDVSDVKKYDDTPMMVKVKSARGVKFAIELINKMLEGVPKNTDLEMIDYVEPEIPAEQLAGSYLQKSFLGKLCQLDREVKDYYSSVKNSLISYKKVNSRVSFSYDSFKLGRKAVAKLSVRGKTLVLFLALNPNDYLGTKYYPKDFSDVKRYVDTPMMVKVKSTRGVKYAIELIDKMLEGVNKTANFEPTTFSEPYMSDAKLLQKGLAKLVKTTSNFIK